jgi:2-keto-3-deoxy-6-phosphogluconate aldolase
MDQHNAHSEVDPSEANLTEWFKSEVICVGIGSQFISSEIIKYKDYSKLEKDVHNAIITIQKLR